MVALPRGVNLGHTGRFSRSGSPTLLGIVNWAGDTPDVCGPGVLGRSRRVRQGRVEHGEGLSVVGVPASQQSGHCSIALNGRQGSGPDFASLRKGRIGEAVSARIK